jgi:hypothetical protein
MEKKERRVRRPEERRAWVREGLGSEDAAEGGEEEGRAAEWPGRWCEGREVEEEGGKEEGAAAVTAPAAGSGNGGQEEEGRRSTKRT